MNISDSRERHQGIQGHEPRGGFILCVLGQQEADGHVSEHAAAHAPRHRHLHLRPGVRRVRRLVRITHTHIFILSEFHYTITLLPTRICPGRPCNTYIN